MDKEMIVEKLPPKFKVYEKKDYRTIDCHAEANMLQEILDSASKERDIQKYIKDNEKWFIPLSILKSYDFGHHFSCVIPEYALGSEYRTDYLLIGKNSLGYNFVFVEFENINVDYTIKSGKSENDAVRKGLIQINEWKRWLEENKTYFQNSEGIRQLGGGFPSWAFHYCLVVSRRKYMTECANQLRGEKKRENNINIMTYDRLIDYVEMLYNGI